MEMSTIPLNLLKYKFDRPMMSIANTVIFIITFFLSRLIVFPWLWGRWIWTYYEEITDDGPESCYPSYFIYIVVSIGLVFHGLNIFWMFRIIKGAIKKIRGAFSNTHRKNNWKEFKAKNRGVRVLIMLSLTICLYGDNHIGFRSARDHRTRTLLVETFKPRSKWNK